MYLWQKTNGVKAKKGAHGSFTNERVIEKREKKERVCRQSAGNAMRTRNFAMCTRPQDDVVLEWKMNREHRETSCLLCNICMYILYIQRHTMWSNFVSRPRDFFSFSIFLVLKILALRTYVTITVVWYNFHVHAERRIHGNVSMRIYRE